MATYTFLTAAELWRERRKHLLRRWPAIFVPMLHGLVFLCPIPLASVLPDDNGIVALASGWIAVFTLEVMLYIVGTAFIVLVLSKERSVRIHKDAASTDELTGVLNRRGFIAAARQLIERFAQAARAGQRAGVRSRSLQEDQRPLRPCDRRRGAAAVRDGAGRQHAGIRHPRPPRRRGVRRHPAGLASIDAAVAAERVRAGVRGRRA